MNDHLIHKAQVISLNLRGGNSFVLFTAIILNLILILSACSNGDSGKTDYRNEKIELIGKISDSNFPADSLHYLLDMALEEKDMHAVALLYKELGKRKREQADFSKAIEYHQQGLNVAYAIEDTTEIVVALNNLGTDFRRIGAYPEAYDYHHRALQTLDSYSLFNEDVSKKNRVIAINGIGNIHLSYENYDDADSMFREALIAEKRLGSNLGQAINYANLGAIFELTGKYDSAFVYFQRSMEYNMLAKSQLGTGLCYIHFGRIYELQEEYDKAEREYLLAYDIMSQLSDRWHWLEATLALARINLLNKEFDEYKEFIELANTTASEIESPEHLSAVYNIKHQYYTEIGDFESALENFKIIKMYEDSIQNMQKLNKVIDLRMNYERDRNRGYIAELNLRNEMEIKQKRTIIRASIVTLLMLVLLSGSLLFAYVQRTKSNRILKNLNQLRNTFFTNITHEFRTPLTVILGLSKHMQTVSDLDQDETASFMKAIERQGSNLMKLVNQLLNMSKINAGMDNPEWYKGDIVLFVRLIIDSLKLYAKSKNLKLIFTCRDESIEMEFVPSYINDIVQNLLSNAIKYSFSGEEINIYVSKLKNRQVSINVTDTGVGINEDDLEHIFNLFYQGEQSDKNSGSGIGLSYTYKMVEYMNGKIEVESRENKGARFTVRLPQYQNREIDLPIWKPNEDKTIFDFINIKGKKPFKDISEAERDSKKTEQAHNYNYSILLIEDNDDVLLYLKSLLPPEYNVITARDGSEGFELAMEVIPDIIISDVMMPVKDGLTLCNDIRSSSLLNHIPIILLTAKSSRQDWIKGVKYGADAYIKKPFNFEELLVQIETLIENRRLLKEKYRNLIMNKAEVPEKDLNFEFLQKATDIVYDEMDNPEFSTGSLAERLAISSSQLNRKLAAVSGYTPSTFITKHKIEYAKRQLATDNRPIGQIAEECGYSDIAYFSRTFKKMTSLSPSQFRRLSN